MTVKPLCEDGSAERDRLVPLSALVAADRQPPLPMHIALPGAPERLQLDAWLRTLPGQRYVGAGRWKGRRVLAKLLVGSKVDRHYQRELQGAQWLAGSGLPTPALLAHGKGPGGAWLLFEFLEQAQSLGDAWCRVADEPFLSPGQRAVLDEALEQIARLHGAGLWQDDLHLDNLLRQAGVLHLIDGGGIRAETPGQPLSRPQVVDNLGVFLAQLPGGLRPFYDVLLEGYRRASPAGKPSLDAVRQAEQRARDRRLRDYLRKTSRDCTLFSVQRSASGLRAVWRQAETWLAPLLAAPDAFMAQGRCFKDGGTATVAGVTLSGRDVVVKRYNIKHVRHWLSRCWRPSRAWHSWHEAHRLQLLGIATPPALAVLEERRFGLRGRAYLVTECLAGQDILSRFQPYLDGSPPEFMLRALDRLFAALIEARISHGDFKGTNLFWQGNETGGQWALIDLDAMHQHRCPRRYERAWQRDRSRFLRNWPSDSPLYRLLDERLPKSSLKRNT